MPQLSVHLAVKDGADTLELAVSSTLRALPRDAELLVLDDASRDDPMAALSGISDPRLRVMSSSRSSGIGAARQLMLDSTDSHYVATMDADDITLPTRFRSQLRVLESKADFAFSPIIGFWNGTRRIRPGLPLPITADAMPLHMLVHNLLCNPTMTARREAVVQAGGYRGITAEDHDLWLRALANGLRLVRTALPLLAYRHHERQTSMQRGFLGEAFADPRLRQAYAEFVDRQFGVVPTWVDALWSDESGTSRMTRELAPLKALLDRRSKDLPASQRAVLARTVRHLDVRG